MRLLLFVLALALVGCVSVTTNRTIVDEATTPLVCANAAQCDTYWKRAQAWVATNSTYWKIQTVSDAIIQTYGPSTSVFLAYTVTREQHQDGSARIVVNPHCGNPFGCSKDRLVEAAAFKRFVRE